MAGYDTAPIVLRDYQEQLVAQALAAPERRVALYGPTGSGKTEVGMELVRRLSDEGMRVTWCANRIDLIDQTSMRFAKAGIMHGIVQARHMNTDYMKPIQIASIQTINRRKFLPGLDAIIVDEAHGATSPMYRKFLDAHDVRVFGLTATPFSKGLGLVFDRLLHTTTVRDLTEKGWLVPARYFAPDRPDLKGVRITAGDYNEADLAARVDTSKLVGNIVAEWKKRAAGCKTVVFATSIDHSKHIVEQFVAHGIAAEHLDAYTDPSDRRAILRRLRSGDTTIVSNVSVLAEGFDCPDIECMILARPTKSVIRYLQMVGRVLRPAPGKEYALVLDHSASVETLGFADDDRPLVLDDGAKKERTDKDGIEKPPYVCPSCKAVHKRRVVPCPSCGFKPEKAHGTDVDMEDGTLRELTKQRFDHAQKQAIYSGLLGYARDKGYKDGWIAHSYRDITGVWPRGLIDAPGPMPEAAKNYLIHKRIKWAKARGNRPFAR